MVLFLAFLLGGTAFLLGRGVQEVRAQQPRRALLPVAGDRVLPHAGAEGKNLAPLAERAASPTTPLKPVTTTEEGDWVRIPSLGVRVPLARAASTRDTDVLKTLTRGAALYPNGVLPGQPGTAFISGHSTGLSVQGAYRFAFLRLHELQPGDTILVDYGGTRFTYRLTGKRMIDPRTTPTLDASGDTPMLSVMSCWPLWTTRERLVGDAALIAVDPLVVQSA